MPERSQTLREALAEWVAEALGLRMVAQAAQEGAGPPGGSAGSPEASSSPTSTSGPYGSPLALGFSSGTSTWPGREPSGLGASSSPCARTADVPPAHDPAAETSSGSLSLSLSTQPPAPTDARLEALIDAVIERELHRILAAALGSRPSSRAGSSSTALPRGTGQTFMPSMTASMAPSSPTSGSYAGTPNFRVDQVA